MTTIHRLRLWSCLILIGVSTGCTHLTKVTYKPGENGPAQYNCPVSLRLTKDFCDYKHVKHHLGDSFVMAFGPALRDYANFVVRNEFGDVEVIAPDSSAPPREQSKLLLEPKIAKSDELMPGLAFQKKKMLMVIEWAVSDPKTGKMLLLVPVEARITQSNPGGGFSERSSAEKLASNIMATLTTNTLQAFSSSEDFKALSNR